MTARRLAPRGTLTAPGVDTAVMHAAAHAANACAAATGAGDGGGGSGDHVRVGGGRQGRRRAGGARDRRGRKRARVAGDAGDARVTGGPPVVAPDERDVVVVGDSSPSSEAATPARAAAAGPGTPVGATAGASPARVGAPAPRTRATPTAARATASSSSARRDRGGATRAPASAPRSQAPRAVPRVPPAASSVSSLLEFVEKHARPIDAWPEAWIRGAASASDGARVDAVLEAARGRGLVALCFEVTVRSSGARSPWSRWCGGRWILGRRWVCAWTSRIPSSASCRCWQTARRHGWLSGVCDERCAIWRDIAPTCVQSRGHHVRIERRSRRGMVSCGPPGQHYGLRWRGASTVPAPGRLRMSARGTLAVCAVPRNCLFRGCVPAFEILFRG